METVTSAKMKTCLATLLLCLFSRILPGAASADDGYRLWLKYDPVADAERLAAYRQATTVVDVPGTSDTSDIIRNELSAGLGGLLAHDVSFGAGAGGGTLVVATPQDSTLVNDLDLGRALRLVGPEGYLIRTFERGGGSLMVIAASTDVGLLYGTFHLLRMIQTHAPIASVDIASRPRIQNRLLNHWDNLGGTIERGSAGKSLWRWDDLPGKVDPRYVDYARANASIGINGAVLNNVNANPVFLKAEYLRKVAAIAEVFRPYGIRVFLSANF